MCEQLKTSQYFGQRWGQVTHVQVSSKSQVTVQTNQASQVKSVAHLKQVKSSPDKGQVKSQYQTGTNIFLSHDLINFSSDFFFLIIHFK